MFFGIDGLNFDPKVLIINWHELGDKINIGDLQGAIAMRNKKFFK